MKVTDQRQRSAKESDVKIRLNNASIPPYLISIPTGSNINTMDYS
jgi:hypothetical protein